MFEEYEKEQVFSHGSNTVLRHTSEVLMQLIEPSCQFLLPLSFFERLRLRMRWWLKKVDILPDSLMVVADETPLYWKVILRYLMRFNIVYTDTFPRAVFQNDEPKIDTVALKGFLAKRDTDGVVTNYFGFSSSLNIEEARSKAIGELIERYVFATYKYTACIQSSICELKSKGKTFLNMTDIPVFAPWQKENDTRMKYTETTPFAWVKGRELTQNTDALIPAQSIYWNFNYVHSREPILYDATSNGIASYFTTTKATIHGIYEVIERDGFLIHWLNEHAPSRIDIDTINDREVQDLVAYIRRYGYQVHILNTSTDLGIPCITCVIVDERTEEPCMSVGASAGFSIASMVKSAVWEAVIVQKMMHANTKMVLPDTYEPFRDRTIRRAERMYMWRGVEMKKRFNFFMQGPKETAVDFEKSMRTFSSDEDELAHALSICLEGGHKVYSFEAHHEILEKLGFHAVKVVIPTLVPLYLRENLAPLASARLRLVPEKMGFRSPLEWYPYPHPFP